MHMEVTPEMIDSFREMHCAIARKRYQMAKEAGDPDGMLDRIKRYNVEYYKRNSEKIRARRIERYAAEKAGVTTTHPPKRGRPRRKDGPMGVLAT